jgi:hypothetical protein
LIESAQSIDEIQRRSTGCRLVGQESVNKWVFCRKIGRRPLRTRGARICRPARLDLQASDWPGHPIIVALKALLRSGWIAWQLGLGWLKKRPKPQTFGLGQAWR